MARVTVEDCVDKVKDRFELVAVAAQRAKNIASGSELTIDRNGEKNSVIALREIEAGKIDVEDMKEALVLSSQRYRPMDEDVEDIDALGSDAIDDEIDSNESLEATIAEEAEAPVDEAEEVAEEIAAAEIKDLESEEANYSFDDDVDVDD